MRRLLVILMTIALVAASTGCSILDTINRLPGTIAGKSSTPKADYSKPDQMPGALEQLRKAAGADARTYRLTIGADGASVFTLGASYRLVDGKISPDTDVITPIANQAVPLSSLDPIGAWNRLSRAATDRGCTDPTRIAMSVYASGKVINDITCTLGGESVQLVEGPQGDLLTDLDLTTKAGIAKAVADVLAVNQPGARYEMFAFQYDTSSGVPSLTTTAGRVGTLRVSKISGDVPALFQSDTGVDPTAKSFDIAGITPETFATVYDAAKKKCGTVSLLHLVLATNGQPMFLSGSFSCPYQADRTGKPI